MELLLKKYAELAIKIGLNLQPGQSLVITSTLENPHFTHLVVEEAYKAGASKVDVEWSDPYLDKLRYAYESDEVLSTIPEYEIAKKKALVESKSAMMSIGSPNPSILKEVDPAKIQLVQRATSKALSFYRTYRSNSESQWLGLCIPNSVWASLVYKDDSSEKAMERLWMAIFESCRINEKDDAIALWKEHVDRLLKHREILTQHAFKELRFKNSLGTDLQVGLVSNHQWSGGLEVTPEGIGFTPNLPTEEIFCMPHRLNVNGKVVATKPLNVQGKLVEDFYFVFKDGKVVEYDAKVNKEALTHLLETDEGATHLGEVALISNDSPISNMNLIFYNTLYDENASCHLALGNCYGSNLKGSSSMTKEQMQEMGANFSMIHCDFMFGNEDMEVVGVKEDGSQVALFKQGNFII